MESGTKMSGRAVRRTLLFGILLKLVVIVASNLVLGKTEPNDIVGLWTRFAPSLVADVVIGWLYVFFHSQHLPQESVRADVGGKGGFISSLAIQAVVGILAIIFGLCGTILNIGDPSHTEGLTTLAVGLANLWFSEYYIILTSRGTIILIGSMLSAISGALSTVFMARVT